MNLDLGKQFAEKEKKFDYDDKKRNMKNLYDKTEYKTRLLNVDSNYRNQIPKNIYTSTNIILSNNPIKTTSNSNILQINYPNNNFSVGDKIIIQNVEGLTKTITNNLYFFINFQYLFVYFPNHGIKVNYLDNIDYFHGSLNIINDIGTKTSYGNIPINAITGVFDIYLPSLVDKKTPLLPEILSILNVNTAGDLDNDYFLIYLPYPFTTSSGLYYVASDVYTISILNISGIPLGYINADYRINYERFQGYQTITNIDADNIYIQTAIKAYCNTSSGGNKIQIMKIINTLDGYPDANNYTISLKHGFNNVVRIELVSTEIPYIDFLVINNTNNNLYWKHYDDGNYVYQLVIPEGNYTGTSLVDKITTLINQVTRFNSTVENPTYNIFSINLDSFSQEITFSPYKNTALPNSLSVSILEVNNVKYVQLTVNHPGNLVQSGDTIVISGAVKIGTIIDASYINTTLTIYSINVTEQTYSALLAPLNQITNQTSIDITGNGGPSTIIKTKAKVSFLFNYSNTIGTILGFKDVGQNNAITPYKTVISNLDDYVQSTNLNQVGNIDTSKLLFNFTGSNLYILMYLNNYECVINNSDQDIAFAKIILSGNPGDILFNTFINYPLEFDFPLSTLNELTVTFKYPNGDLVDFRNINHSFTLRIMEQIKYPYNTNINSKDVNFIDTIKEVRL
jgi:hypothetical protein